MQLIREKHISEDLVRLLWLQPPRSVDISVPFAQLAMHNYHNMPRPHMDDVCKTIQLPSENAEHLEVKNRIVQT